MSCPRQSIATSTRAKSARRKAFLHNQSQFGLNPFCLSEFRPHVPFIMIMKPGVLQMKVNAALAALVLALSPTLAPAEVADSSSNGFTVKAAFTINAAPEEVYRRLIN